MPMIKRLVELREKARLSQRAAAKKIGIALIVYQRYEWGIQIPSIKRATLIASAFGIDNPREIWTDLEYEGGSNHETQVEQEAR